MAERIYVEKKTQFDTQTRQLLCELRTIAGVTALENLRILKRYDVEGITPELFHQCIDTVFSEPQTDVTYTDLGKAGIGVSAAVDDGTAQAPPLIFAVEYLPGQFDQRANSASECIQLISQTERPAVRTAQVYVLVGSRLTDTDISTIRAYVVNPVDSRIADLARPRTLKTAPPEPGPVETLNGFRKLSQTELKQFIEDYGLAMDLADTTFCQSYFREEERDPTITEIRVIDTYWSDHCRHTTFNTQLDDITIDDTAVKKAFNEYLRIRRTLQRDNKPVSLMDMGTIGARYLKSTGILKGLDESEEINACTVKVTVDVDGKDQDWLLLFKNETHNHPTEIEPFGGAATCVGGAIRDPLSGRSYVYQAMRITGASDPRVPVSETLEGKLPQRKLVTTAAAGFSSYGNQIGLAAGEIHELYHPGYVAKRMEIGAVVGAAPQANVRHEAPKPGDKVLLLGGRTGRDGIGGATGASKSHNVRSIEKDGAEVQKGNAPVERKLQRLFRRHDAASLIKRCNDFGAGGVSVAVGELADSLEIYLDTVPKKYDGLDGTELAISESQERMAIVLAPEDVDAFLAAAHEENLDATVIAEVTGSGRMRMQWKGRTIVDLSRKFLASNGAGRSQHVHIARQEAYRTPDAWHTGSFSQRMAALAGDINAASQKGLSERFDSTIGAATVLMPFGGRRQLTPPMAMVAKFPVDSETTTASAMAWGFNPYIMEADQFAGAYLSVVESVSKLIASGFSREKSYLSFQEYFEKLGNDPSRWGKPAAAMLGSLMAQIDLGVGAIGGKDSMSGSFENLDVPPTLVSFAVATGEADDAVSPEFKEAGHQILRISPRYKKDGITPDPHSMVEVMDAVQKLMDTGITPDKASGCTARGAVLAAATPGYGCTAQALFLQCAGNQIGVKLNSSIHPDDLFIPRYGSFIIELSPAASHNHEAVRDILGSAGFSADIIGETTDTYTFSVGGEETGLADIQEIWESALEPVFPYRDKSLKTAGAGMPQTVYPADKGVEPLNYDSSQSAPQPGTDKRQRRLSRFTASRPAPKVIIPVFPGNNCEYDSAKAFRRAGADTETFIVNNRSPQDVTESVKTLADKIRHSQIIMIPGGFSGGDEPDGSAKFITAFFRSPEITDAVRDLLNNRDGLILGICNGFQALIKLGLVPYGDFVPATDKSPTLTFNTIGRHQSRLVHTRIASTLSPWLSQTHQGDIHTVAVSHGEGRFVADRPALATLVRNGQIATQYTDEAGTPSMSLDVNPNGSVLAVEGITSPDGRIFGKMGHSERSGNGLYRNVPGAAYQPIFEGGVRYFLD